MTIEATSDPRVWHWLSHAAALQFASLALQTPTSDVLDELRALIPSLPAEQRDQARRILEWQAADWQPEFFSVLGPAGCAVAESSYERGAMASRGPLLARVAGYYQAFGYAPERMREVPDHVAVELGFLAFLAMKAAFARFEGRTEDADIVEDAFADFRRHHVGAWLPECVSAIEATGSAHYALIARLAAASIENAAREHPSA